MIRYYYQFSLVSFQLSKDIIHNWQAIRNSRQQQQTRANLQLSNDGNRTGIGVGNGLGIAAAGHERWIPPAQGMYKCNIDAAIKEQNRFGAGMCIRDLRGNFIRAQMIWTYGNPLPHKAEPRSLKAAISWLHVLGFSIIAI
jgi:hypothetical protein